MVRASPRSRTATTSSTAPTSSASPRSGCARTSGCWPIPLGQGYLTGKYQGGARPAGARTTLFNRGQRYEKPGVEPAIAGYLALAREFGLDPTQMALAFVTSRKFVASNIIGATSIAQLETVLGSAEVAITPELEDRIDAIHQVHQNPAP